LKIGVQYSNILELGWSNGNIIFSFFIILPSYRCSGYKNSFIDNLGLAYKSNNAGLVP